MAEWFACVGCKKPLEAQAVEGMVPLIVACTGCLQKFMLQLAKAGVFELEYEVEQQEVVSSEGHAVWCEHERWIETEEEANATAVARSQQTGDLTRVVRAFRQVIRRYDAKGVEEVQRGG